MIKNPIHADLQLWIGAVERIYNSGISKIAAIHRGFHYYGKTKYRNKPFWQIPIELRTLFPDLPIICDSSHISGNKELIPSVSQKALDLGMNGLMIETHYNPDLALSDASQQYIPSQLDQSVPDRHSRFKPWKCLQVFPGWLPGAVVFTQRGLSLRTMQYFVLPQFQK
jgi:chorismate mutase